MAGNGFSVDVEFVEGRVMGVVLSFPEAKEAETEGTAVVGAEVLRRDLLGKDGESGYVELEAFAGNLGRLARMGQLGTEGVSCFDAVEGVWSALRKIWVWEVGRHRGDGQAEEEVEREVICRGSGRPRMHGRGMVGLRLEYWMERRLVSAGARKGKEAEKKTDGKTKDKELEDEENEKVWSMLIDCEAFSATEYPCIRVSDSWVSEAIEKPMLMDDNLFTGDNSSIDWQEPPSTFTSQASNTDPEAMNIDSDLLLSGKLPNVRFVARLDPPVTVPLQTAIQIFNSVGTPLGPEFYQTTTYMSLLIPSSSKQPKSQSKKPIQEDVLTFRRTLDSYKEDGSATSHHHLYNLTIHQGRWARTITDIPFSHPKQLVMILPTLRQWAFLDRLLQRTFAVDSLSAVSSSLSAQPSTSDTINGTGRNLLNNGLQKSLRQRRSKQNSKFHKHARPPTPSDTESDSDPPRPLPSTPKSKKPTNSAQSVESQPDTTAQNLDPPTRKIDLSLNLALLPRVELTVSVPPNRSYPGHYKREGSKVHFHITPGAEISAVWDKTGWNSSEATEGENLEREDQERKAVRLLSLSEDLGIVGEWMGKYRR